MTSYDFNAPILVAARGTILAGHGRLEAAKFAGLTKVPVIYLNHLNEDQATAFMLADNKLAEMSKWDEPRLAEVIKELAAKTLEFELEDTGFDPAEIDRMTRIHQRPAHALQARHDEGIT
jgi:ParB-like chromosome segregation protein Spo0J